MTRLEPVRPHESLSVTRTGGVVRVVLDRPEHGNSIDRTTGRELMAVLDDVERDDTVAAVVLCGAGDRFFCTGGDVKEYATLSRPELEAQFALMRRICHRLEALPVPTIAAIDGATVGGGFELALACDLRICSDRSWFQFPNVKLGLVTAWGGARRLREAVGRSRALEILLTGRRLPAQDALRFGLVTSLSPDPLAAADALCDDLGNAPLAAVREIKRDVLGSGAGEWDEGDAAGRMMDLWFSVGAVHDPGSQR